MATPRPMSTGPECIGQAALMVQMAFTHMRPFQLHQLTGGLTAINGLSLIFRALTLPEQWFAWTGELAHVHSALARQFVDRIPHKSKMWLIARAGLS